jgi:hypothetical protein
MEEGPFSATQVYLNNPNIAAHAYPGKLEKASLLLW